MSSIEIIWTCQACGKKKSDNADGYRAVENTEKHPPHWQWVQTWDKTASEFATKHIVCRECIESLVAEKGDPRE